MNLQQAARIPAEAREGLMRARLEILCQRHPGAWRAGSRPDGLSRPGAMDLPQQLSQRH
jgi:hypothetical protein